MIRAWLRRLRNRVRRALGRPVVYEAVRVFVNGVECTDWAVDYEVREEPWPPRYWDEPDEGD